MNMTYKHFDETIKRIEEGVKCPQPFEEFSQVDEVKSLPYTEEKILDMLDLCRIRTLVVSHHPEPGQ